MRASLTILLGLMLAFGAGSLGWKATSAYNDYNQTSCRWPFSGGYSNLYPKWDWASGSYEPTGIYVTAYLNAKSNWNAQASSAVFTQDTTQSSHLWIIEYQGLNGQYGNFYGNCPGNIWSSRTVNLNRTELEFAWPDHWYKQWTASHELGHQMSVGHTHGYGFVGGQYQYFGGTLTEGPDQAPPYGANGARPDDVCGVTSLYPNIYYPVTTPCGD